MNSAILRNPVRIRLYWSIWIALVAVAFALRFTLFWGASEQRRFALATGYGLGTWLPIMALNLIEGRNLTLTLRSRHYREWEQLNYVPFLGCVGHNGFRMLRWLYSKEDFGDPIVVSLKAEHRSFIRFVLTVFLSYIVIMPGLLIGL